MHHSSLFTRTFSSLALVLAVAAHSRAAGPAMVGYSMYPNRYVDDHAAELKQLFDGFFFTVGNWDDAQAQYGGAQPKAAEWLKQARSNIAALRRAGATENFLTVAFGETAGWPSPETLLQKSYTAKMANDFRTIGRVARELGFCGVCIDVEYPYPRYEVGHAVYTYSNYAVGDLLKAARDQGRQSMKAILEEFPDAVIMTLPGEIRTRPIGREYVLGLFEEMVDRDAPGGFHCGSEFTYCLNEPITHLAVSHFEDPAIGMLAGRRAEIYWRKHCSMAPGVWPLHMIETGGKDYPIQPWSQEVAELREQLSTVRAASKRYVWSYSGNPTWYCYTPELEAKYGLHRQDLKRDDIDLKLWHDVLRSRENAVPKAYAPLLKAIRQFDQGKLSGEALCDRFGTPANWWVLGPLGHAQKTPQFTAQEALSQPIDPQTPYQGLRSVVRWSPYRNLDPRGFINAHCVFDYRNTDDTGAHFVTLVNSPTRRTALLHLGWDDLVDVRLNGKTVFDTRNANIPRGKGWQYRDRYCYEKSFPVQLEKGKNQLSVSSYNFWGAWIFSVRLTDEHSVPYPDLKFTLR